MRKPINDLFRPYYKDNKLHREDGPAIEFSNGDKFWYLNDEPHREDGPACEWIDGDKEWYIDGKEYSEYEFKLIQELKILDKIK